MKDNFQTLADRAVPGMVPWRSGMSVSKSEDDDELTEYLWLIVREIL